MSLLVFMKIIERKHCLHLLRGIENINSPCIWWCIFCVVSKTCIDWLLNEVIFLVIVCRNWRTTSRRNKTTSLLIINRKKIIEYIEGKQYKTNYSQSTHHLSLDNPFFTNSWSLSSTRNNFLPHKSCLMLCLILIIDVHYTILTIVINYKRIS